MQGSGQHLRWAGMVAREDHGQTCMPGSSPAEMRENSSLDHPCWVQAVSQDLHTWAASAPGRYLYQQNHIGSPQRQAGSQQTFLSRGMCVRERKTEREGSSRGRGRERQGTEVFQQPRSLSGGTAGGQRSCLTGSG